MSTASPAIQNLARQLLAGEAARSDAPHGDVDQAVRACEKLRVPLTKLAGAAGFSSLLSRALALASRQAPSLQRLRVEPGGLLAKVDENSPELDEEQSLHTGEVLVAELLRLLIALIGQALTLTLVREAWPDVPVETMLPRTEEKP